MKFSVFRKPTNSESYLHFFSYNALHIKVGLAQSLFLRAYRICSHEYLEDEIDHIFKTLKKLAYPNDILKKALSKAPKAFYKPKIKNITKDFQKNIVVPMSSH